MDLRRGAGFTIVELIVVLSIVAILSALAAPDLAMFIKNNRVKGQAFDLLNAIQYARSEAGKRRVRVILCRDDPDQPGPQCGDTHHQHDWTSGWLVFASGDTNSTYDSADDDLLRISPPAPTDVSVFTNDTCNRNLEYNADGTTHESDTALFAICDTRGGTYGRRIEVPPHGRPKLEQGSPGSAIDCELDHS